ncbi:glycosyltransferase family 4 protein [Novipirellula artificiosorum]|uniref:2-deoxystreptamine glucosyltransferase n=1 Tax=Novipirellula artificiosorum TaxID=2528016 RepID=A0A5C6D9Y6_9BACT|nr:glycosyltransferase family 4 protein [Novipirellula artificiosorum]TWU32614.1 2-deoxystreptamine glucosyltransferase [Novipirellula artificiosorum]
MKILFYCHYFPPEVNAPATRTYQHARRWVAAGHDVTVVTCAPNCPDGVVFDGYKNRLLRQVEMVDGIRVVRVWTYVAANAGMLPRIANYVSYQISAMLATLRLPRPDVVVATSPQFFCGWAGVWASRLKWRPFVLEIRDIWPESIAAVGAMKKGIATRFLEWLELRMYRAADHIVAVGTGYRDNVARKVPEMADKISVITNGVDAASFEPLPRDDEFLRKYGLQDKFVCSYVGTIGMAHGLEVAVKAAAKLKAAGRTDIAFLIVGDGAYRERLVTMASEKGVSKLVVFTGRLSKEQMPTVLASSDCCLVHLHGTDLFGTVIPSKIFETMAMERPIIMGVKGPARDIVIEAGGGQPMIPDDDDDLVRIVTEMADHPTELAETAKHARAYVLEHYDRDQLAAKMLDILVATAKK